MRNVSKMMCDIAATNGFCPNVVQKQKQSKFLEVERVHQGPIIPTYSLFDECEDNYEPDKDFINESY